MRHLSIAFLSVILVTAACGGDEESSNPQLPPFPTGSSGVFPDSSYLGKTMELVLYGSGTQWAQGVSVDFGPGVTVNSTSVEGPTTIKAEVTVDIAAELGSHDVKVNNQMLDGKFLIESPLQVTVEGTQAQGSVIFLSVTNLDVERPFDTTSTGDGFFSPLEYTNFTADFGGAGTNAMVNQVTPFTADLLVTIDTTAAAGARTLTIATGSGGKAAFAAPNVAEIAARSAVNLSDAEPNTATQSEPLGTTLYKVEASALTLFELSAALNSEVEGASPSLVLLPESGSFLEMLGQGTEQVLTAEKELYVIYFDASLASGYDYTINVGSITPNVTKELEPNDEANPMAMNLPFHSPAELGAVDDEDWYSFSLNEAGVLRVITEAAGGHYYSDPKIFVYAASNTSTPVAESDDSNYQESLTTESLAAGNYLVKIVWSPDYADAYDGTQTEYKVTFWQ